MAAQLREGGTAHDIHVALVGKGHALASSVFAWIVAERRRKCIEDSMRSSFAGAQLVEQPTAHSFRYKAPSSETVTLAAMFDRIEQCKLEVGISEYSIGQTTLEHIFNQFASSQLNPEV